MGRFAAAGVILAAWAALAIQVAGTTAAAGPHPAAGPVGRNLTGNLVALVRTRPLGALAGSQRRDARIESARRRIVKVVARTSFRRVRSIPLIGEVTVRPPPGGGLAGARRELAADPAVLRVAPERYRTLRYLPNDPALTMRDPHAPSGDHYQWNLRREGLPAAWNRTRGRHAKLAIIDTGVDGDQPDLKGRIVRAADQTGNADCGGLLEPPCTPARHDDFGHGTHVAGLACGQGNNRFGLAGAAFACSLIDEKASHSVEFRDTAIAESIVDATGSGADVINMSFGGPGRAPGIRAAIHRAFAHGVVLVAAARNDRDPNPITNGGFSSGSDQGVPAAYLQPEGSGPRIRSGRGLVVTAALHNRRPAWFGPGHGTGISLAAYGAASSACEFRSDCGIFSTFPSNPTEIEEGNVIAGEPGCGNCRASFDGSDDFAYLEGTSMAAPQVAGAAALIRSERPGIANTKVIRVIKRTASGHAFGANLGWGILNAGRALRRATR